MEGRSVMGREEPRRSWGDSSTKTMCENMEDTVDSVKIPTLILKVRTLRNLDSEESEHTLEVWE